MTHPPADSLCARAYIGGTWQAARGDEEWTVVNPATEEPLAFGRGASREQVWAAAAAASHAFASWRGLSAIARAGFLQAIAAAMESRANDLAALITLELGTPVRVCRSLQVDAAIRIFRDTAELLRELPESEWVGSSEVHRVPIGVTGCITPWNYPLYLSACKIAPALAAGCTVVLKPSEMAPLALSAMIELIQAVQLPAGVLNVVLGPGAAVGNALTDAPGVDAISFTGSVTTGAAVAAHAGRGLRRVTLELGGKSATVVLRDGDLESAVAATVMKCFQNAGQTCAAFSRLIVPKNRQKAAEALAADAAARFAPGDPQLFETALGPVASAAQRTHVRQMIEEAQHEGARLVSGGAQAPPHLPRGFYVAPTVLSDVRPSFRIAQEEVFGPVLAILTYEHDEEALAIAEGTKFGLSASVWAVDEDRAAAFAQRMRAGSISLNGASVTPYAPFGGFKHSGFGRERGRAGIEEFLTTQALHFARSRARLRS